MTGRGNLNRLSKSIVGAVIAACAAPSHAEVIQEILHGDDVLTIALGQAIRIQSGPSWDHLSFNWFDGSGNPTAAGSLFLLDQQYLGTPDDLGSATPGFIAETRTISGGVYYFEPNVQLSPGTLYYFYTTTPVETTGHQGDDDYNKKFLKAVEAGERLPVDPGPCAGGGVGCQAYIALSTTTPFYEFPPRNDADFVLSGNAIVPEPAMIAPTGLMLVLLFLYLCRSRCDAGRFPRLRFPVSRQELR